MDFRILPVTPFQQNCTLLWCTATRRAAIIDPGGEAPRILRLIDELKLEPERILLTHGHLDHVGATAELAERLAVPIWGPHRDDAFLIQGLAQQCEMFGFPLVPGFEPDHWLAQGDRVPVGEETLEVLHCPGHTPGHVVFFHRDGATRSGRGRALPGLHRAHGLPPREPPSAARVDYRAALSPGRRGAFHPGPWSHVHLRGGAAEQPLRWGRLPPRTP